MKGRNSGNELEAVQMVHGMHPGYWEHLITDEDDYRRHVDYLHFNPVKHGLVTTVSEWPYSTFHRFVRQGIYPPDWGAVNTKADQEARFGE